MAIKCEQAGGLIDKRDTEKLSFKENIQLKIHLINCALCKGYNTFSTKFRNVFVDLKKENQTLSVTEKESLKVSIENKASIENKI